MKRSFGLFIGSCKCIFIISVFGQLTACGGGGGNAVSNQSGTIVSPKNNAASINAMPDSAITEQGTAVNIPVLANDSGTTSSTIQLNVTTSPGNGNVSVLPDNTITYTPNALYTGTDSFSYKITDQGNVAITNVTILITCANCEPDIILNIRWNSNSDNENVIGYLVYYGTTPDSINNLAYDLSPGTGIDLNNPSVTLSVANDLKLSTSNSICFSVKSYTPADVSEFSQPVCGYI